MGLLLPEKTEKIWRYDNSSELTADVMWNPENLLAGRAEKHCYLGSQGHWCLWNLSIVMKEFNAIVTWEIWDGYKPGGSRPLFPGRHQSIISWEPEMHVTQRIGEDCYLQIGEDHHLKDLKHCSQEDQDQLTRGIWKYLTQETKAIVTSLSWECWHLRH